MSKGSMIYVGESGKESTLYEDCEAIMDAKKFFEMKEQEKFEFFGKNNS